MLNSSAAVPLYVQLKEKIEQKISDGEYKPGEKLQTEGEMAKSFGVSIITVRKAVSELVEKGLVEKKQGKGTFVCQRKVTKDMKKLQRKETARFLCQTAILSSVIMSISGLRKISKKSRKTFVWNATWHPGI